ncbi:MAG: response regulator [bacterium]|nr:response regulator [bacterium]
MNDYKVPTILVVDDEKNLRESLAELLELEGLQVAQAQNGYVAVEKAKANLYDIALIDIRMPGMNGLETLHQVRSLQPNIKAIMMTGHPMEEHTKNSLLTGIYGILYKPFPITKLLAMIQQITCAAV